MYKLSSAKSYVLKVWDCNLVTESSSQKRLEVAGIEPANHCVTNKAQFSRSLI